MMSIAAGISIIILVALTLFQLVLILGFPLGRFAWGGANKILPMNFRIASVFSIVIYIIIAAFAITKATSWDIIQNEIVLTVGLWVIFSYFLMGILLNGISRSKPERYLMTPVSAVLALCFFVLAVS